jgi:hypothetical protein
MIDAPLEPAHTRKGEARSPRQPATLCLRRARHSRTQTAINHALGFLHIVRVCNKSGPPRDNQMTDGCGVLNMTLSWCFEKTAGLGNNKHSIVADLERSIRFSIISTPYSWHCAG